MRIKTFRMLLPALLAAGMQSHASVAPALSQAHDVSMALYNNTWFVLKLTDEVHYGGNWDILPPKQVDAFSQSVSRQLAGPGSYSVTASMRYLLLNRQSGRIAGFCDLVYRNFTSGRKPDMSGDCRTSSSYIVRVQEDAMTAGNTDRVEFSLYQSKTG